MSRSQLQDSDAPAAVPDKAMLATVLSYLKNKNLKETAEVLQKELSTLGGDSTRSMQFSSVGQSGTEPMKYEESYTSNAPFPSTPTLTAAYLKLATANADSANATITTTSPHKASKQPILALPSLKALPTSPIRLNNNFDQHKRSENDGSVGTASPHSYDDGERRVTSTSLTPPPTSATSPGSGDAIQTLKFKPLPFLVPVASSSSSPAATPTGYAAAATTPAKSPDKNPLWFQSTSTPNTTSIPSSLLGGAANGSNGGKSIFFGDATGSGLILKSPPTTMSPSSVIGGTAIHPPASLMYQLMATGPQNCLPNTFLGNAAATAGTVLTVLPSPPTTNIPAMNPPQPVFFVANQSLVKPSPAPQQEKESVHESYEADMEPATGQAQYPSMVSSTTTTVSSPPPPHPRTLASIPPAELTPQHLELKAFAEDFKTRRIRLGFTQGAVGTSLAEKGYNNFAQSTISRFEQMQLSPANAATIRVILEKWLLEAESPDTAPPPNQSDLPMMAGRKRKKRAVFTPQTKSTLDDFFAQNPRPNRQAIEAISQKLDLLPEEVRVWFCNKRQKSKSGSVSSSSAAYDRESSSTTSSGVPSPTNSEGGQSQKRRSPSPPKTPFTIEELSKSSSNGNGGLISSPMHLATSSLLPLGGLVASVTQSMNQPLIFATSVGSPPVIFRGGAAGNKSPPLVLPPQFLATSPIVTDQSLN